MRQVFNSWATQTVRLYADQPFLEFEYTIGPINISDDRGKEVWTTGLLCVRNGILSRHTAHYGPQVITRYATRGFSTDSTWYTDSQGQEMQKRRYNYRPTWPLNVTEPVAGNYYPMNSAAFLRSGNAQITYDCSCPNLRLRLHLNCRLSLIYSLILVNRVVNDRSQACGSVADGELEVLLPSTGSIMRKQPSSWC